MLPPMAIEMNAKNAAGIRYTHKISVTSYQNSDGKSLNPFRKGIFIFCVRLSL